MHRVARGSTVVLWHRLSVRRKSIKPDDIIDIDLVTVETPKSVDQSRDQFWDLESDALVKQEVRYHLLVFYTIDTYFRKVINSTSD